MIHSCPQGCGCRECLRRRDFNALNARRALMRLRAVEWDVYDREHPGKPLAVSEE